MLKRSVEEIEQSRQNALQKLKQRLAHPQESANNSTVPANLPSKQPFVQSIAPIPSHPPAAVQKCNARFELIAKDFVSIVPSNPLSKEYLIAMFANSYTITNEGHLKVPLTLILERFTDLKKNFGLKGSLEKTYTEVAKYSRISMHAAYTDAKLDEVCKKNHLLPFQMEGIQFGISRSGRLLLADDMGLGKTLQALMLAYFYRNEWPLLVICPASLIGTWQEAVNQYFEDVVLPHQVKAFFDSKDFSLQAQVCITSYDLAVRNAQCIIQNSPRVIIVDECHFLKNKTTKRTRTILPILQNSNRLFMLSGTPALSRPMELYTQFSAINSKLFSSHLEFGYRYCEGYKDRFGVNFKGASNMKELAVVLENTIMLRRTKQQVLSWLPAKIRKQIFLHVSTAAPDTCPDDLASIEKSLEDNNSVSFKKWQSATRQKMPAILRYLGELLIESSDDGHQPKILLFAHFKNTLDELEQWLAQHKLAHIRIDGESGTRERQTLCDQFQNDPKICVALLSITAASVGLTLTSAKMVVFAELFWNPGVLIQAEDRVHRIGQKDSVVIQYLLGKGTFDDYLWPLLLKKLNTLEQVGLAQNVFSSSAIETTDRSVIDSRQTRLKFPLL